MNLQTGEKEAKILESAESEKKITEKNKNIGNSLLELKDQTFKSSNFLQVKK
jgi:hypothetical protein